MIVPGNRLLFWFALVVLPCSLLAAVDQAALPVAVSGMVLFGLLTISDALGALRKLAGVKVAMPHLARMSKDRETSLEVRLESKKAKIIRLALGLPHEFRCPQEELRVILPADAEWSRVEWNCMPLKRGNYRLEAAFVETSSPLGFWTARKRVALACEIRVYPNLFGERKDLAALFLNRGSFGLHAQRQVGRGREFEKLREYVPGDGYDELHWKATAKRGHPITKVFQLERTQEVYVLIDNSRLSARAANGSTNEGLSQIGTSARAGGIDQALTTSTLERFITGALLLGSAAEQQGDFFGLLTFSDKVGNFLRARNGKAHYSACRDILYTLEPQLVSPDYDELCTFIRLRLRRRALLVFLTALDDPVLAESFVRHIDLIRRQHLVIVNMLQPPGVAPVFSDDKVQAVDDLYRHLGGHLRWQNLRELQKVLQRRGVHFSLLKNKRFSAEMVGAYLTIKKRQLL